MSKELYIHLLRKFHQAVQIKLSVSHQNKDTNRH